MVDERLHVAHRRAKARAEAALAGRAALAARIPGEHGEVRQVELVGKVRHAAGMLVAAVEQDDGAARRARHGRPMAVEQLDAVVGPEGLLFDWPHDDSSVRMLARQHCGEPALSASPMPARTRLTTVRTSRMASIGTAHPSHAGIGAEQPTQRPSAPNTTARSLLPIGPS